MKEKTGSLTAADFFEKLQHDKLDTTAPLYLMGMVKKSEREGKTIDFAPGGDCSNWVTIPLELIDDVEIMKTISCKDHTHPLVKLNMKTPKTPEGKIFLALLQGMKDASKQPYHSAPTVTPENLGLTAILGRSQGFGSGVGVGGLTHRGLGYSCNSYGCACNGFSDCISMCNETDNCYSHERCINYYGFRYCPWN